MTQFLAFVALFFDFIGLAFVIGAGFIMIGQSLLKLRKSKKVKKKKHDLLYYEHRKNFVHRIILGLDFFIVADLVKVAFANEYQTLVQILLIVIIRTILSYFLLKESDL